METRRHAVVVVGGSAGALEPLVRLTAGLPREFPAPVLVVIHGGADAGDRLRDIVARAAALPVLVAADGAVAAPGTIYIARGNFHLMLRDATIQVAQGPRENNFRPAIDPLFRSAARGYPGRAIAVLLSGALDDGVYGMSMVKRTGGIAVVQHPEEALVAQLPLNAVQHVEVDHIVRSSDMASLLVRLAHEIESGRGGTPRGAVPDALPDVASPDNIPAGPPSTYSCPECGGPLWEAEQGTALRFRCMEGHAYAADTFLASQNAKLEEALWTALRVLDQHVQFSQRLAERSRARQLSSFVRMYQDRADEARSKADLLRRVLAAPRRDQAG
ncbi:MAG TPA: chemotaxis protein CheB [Phycisphaerales bacterium]|nr:chemotaxis protein CheB [Phycisphaerales bacterium]